MLDPIVTIDALAAAAFIAAAAVLLCGWPWRSSRPWLTAAGCVPGVAGGLAASCWLLGVRPHWPPAVDQDRLLLLLLPATLAVELAGVFRGRWQWLVWLPRLAVAVSAPWLLLYHTTYLTGAWTPEQTWMVQGGLAAALMVVWFSLTMLARRAPGRSVPLVVALACAGAAVTTMLSGYLGAGLIGLSLAAALAGAVSASLVLARPPDLQGVIGPGVVGLFALLVMGRFFGDLTTTHAALLFFAPLLCWAPELLPSRRFGPRLRGLLRIALAAGPVVLVLLLAQQQFIKDSTRTSPGSKEPSIEDYFDFGK